MVGSFGRGHGGLRFGWGRGGLDFGFCLTFVASILSLFPCRSVNLRSRHARRPEVNADSNQVAMMDTRTMAWESTEWAGIGRKVLEFVSHPKNGTRRRYCGLLPAHAARHHPHRPGLISSSSMESLRRARNLRSAHLRAQSARHPSRWASKTGGEIYMKWRVPICPGGERLVIDARTAQWMEFPHRGADVLHLYPTATVSRPAASGTCTPTARRPARSPIGEGRCWVRGCLRPTNTRPIPPACGSACPAEASRTVHRRRTLHDADPRRRSLAGSRHRASDGAVKSPRAIGCPNRRQP